MRKGRTPVPSTCVQAQWALLDGTGPSRVPKNRALRNRATQIRASQNAHPKSVHPKTRIPKRGLSEKSPIRTIWRRWRTPPRSQMLNVFSIYENWSVYIGRAGVQGSRKSFATCDSSDNRPPTGRPPGLQDARRPPARNAARRPPGAPATPPRARAGRASPGGCGHPSCGRCGSHGCLPCWQTRRAPPGCAGPSGPCR